jgi:hypothetical protein
MQIPRPSRVLLMPEYGTDPACPQPVLDQALLVGARVARTWAATVPPRPVTGRSGPGQTLVRGTLGRSSEPVPEAATVPPRTEGRTERQRS